jgi:hypothetical protein
MELYHNAKSNMVLLVVVYMSFQPRLENEKER